MGLSSSQARLLNLTARMHDIEYKAQNLEAQKLQMANESTQVYKEYEDALNKQKVQFKKIGSDGAANYENATISKLLQNGYEIQIFSAGKWWNFVGANNDTTKANTLWATYSTTPKEVTLTNLNAGTYEAGSCINTTSNSVVTTGQNALYMVAESFTVPTNGASVTVKVYERETNGYANHANYSSTAGEALKKINLNSVETLRNLVEAGYIIFQKKMTDGTMSEVNIATDTSLQEVSDETELKKAEAKYEADMRKIDAKDKKFDTDLAAMETERNAIKTEMDTLKSVAKDNVDRTFKLFG